MADFYCYTKDQSGKSLKNLYECWPFLFIKNIPENNWEEEEQGHIKPTAVISDTLAEFAGKSHDVRNLLNAVERLFKFLVVLPASSAIASYGKNLTIFAVRCYA